MPSTSVSKRNSGAGKTAGPAFDVAATVELLAAEYGPFDDEPRLDPAHEVVLTILSQHTSDINSSRAFKLLMDRFGSLEAVAEGDTADIEDAISPGGLARIKAPRIKEVLNLILELNGSLDLSFLREMPLNDAREWLKQLPGIGPKSAGIILCFSLGMPAMAIDTHIYRVCQRLGLIGPKVNADKAHDIMEAMVAPEQVFQFHVGFITHGRQVCKAPRPRCAECVIADRCPARDLFVDGAGGDSADTAAAGPRRRGKSPMPHSVTAAEVKKRGKARAKQGK